MYICSTHREDRCSAAERLTVNLTVVESILTQVNELFLCLHCDKNKKHIVESHPTSRNISNIGRKV